MVARAKCVVAEAEIALGSRDLGWPAKALDAAKATLEAHGDRGQALFRESGGMVTSYAEDTGEVVLDRQRLGALGQYVASPIAADGRIYVASESGTVVVFRAADTLEVLARNHLQESITATPAITNGTLYIRTAAHLWAFGTEAGQRSPEA